PSAFRAPAISLTGKVNVGERLTAVVTASNIQSFKYQWYRYLAPSYQTAVKVPQAEKVSFDLAASEIDRMIAIGVTLEKWGAISQEYLSNPSSKVGGQLRLLLTPTPAMSGKYKVGSLLSVRAGRWETGVQLSYQWFRGNIPIKGAKLPTYRLVASDVGKQISVAVTGLKTGLPKATIKSPKSTKIVR
ncbi:MAG: hypothetical protein ACKOFA_02435, partial [Rhodoluna sp.]